MEAQEYLIKSNVLYKDNQSEIHMESIRQVLCTVNYCHIQIRNFFVKDRQDKV